MTTTTEQLTPKQAIKLLDEIIARKAVPQSTGAHYKHAFAAVFPCHPDYETLADIHPELPESFIRYYMRDTKDSHAVSTDRTSRFRSALAFVKAYHRDPRSAVDSRRVRTVNRPNGNGQKTRAVAAPASPVPAGNSNALTLRVRPDRTVTITDLPSDLTFGDVDRITTGLKSQVFATE
jgi:hypothetical protein